MKKELTCPKCGGRISHPKSKRCWSCFIKEKAVKKLKRRTCLAAASSHHIHFWHVDSNNVGVCRKCGERKDFGELMDNAKRLKLALMKENMKLKMATKEVKTRRVRATSGVKTTS